MLGGNAIGSTARGAISNQRHGPILGRFSRSSGTHFAHQVLENLGKTGTHDMHKPDVASKAIVIDGKLASCCEARGPDEQVLRAALA